MVVHTTRIELLVKKTSAPDDVLYARYDTTWIHSPYEVKNHAVRQTHVRVSAEIVVTLDHEVTCRRANSNAPSMMYASDQGSRPKVTEENGISPVGLLPSCYHPTHHSNNSINNSLLNQASPT